MKISHRRINIICKSKIVHSGIVIGVDSVIGAFWDYLLAKENKFIKFLTCHVRSFLFQAFSEKILIISRFAFYKSADKKEKPHSNPAYKYDFKN
jgi:hypothetical protein